MIPAVPVPSLEKVDLLPIAIKLSVLPPCSFIALAEPKVIFSLAESIRTFVDFISSASIVNPPTFPPVNNTDEPVICPLSFSLRIEPTDISPDDTFNPPTEPPVKSKAEAVTSPLAFTLKLVDDINLLFPVAEPLMKKLVDDKASFVILNPPIEPSSAVTLPLITTLPALSKWKLDELISIFPFEPLTNCVEEPKKKPDEDINILSPSNDNLAPAASPAKNFGLLSVGLLPPMKTPLFVPVIPVGLGLPADIKPPWLELTNKLLADNLNTSTSTSKTDAVTFISSERMFTLSPSKNK